MVPDPALACDGRLFSPDESTGSAVAAENLFSHPPSLDLEEQNDLILCSFGIYFRVNLRARGAADLSVVPPSD